MPSTHEIQIMLTKSVNVAENVQAISQAHDSAKNIYWLNRLLNMLKIYIIKLKIKIGQKKNLIISR